MERDLLTGIGVIAAMSFLIIAIGSAILHFFVALNAPPARRAAWTAGIPYAALSLLGSAGTGNGLIAFWMWPVAGIIPAAIVYWYWLRDFQKRWYASTDEIPEDIPWANHDWKNGLLHLLALLVFAIILTVVRRSFD